jgi:hypothetical protein
MAGSRRLMFGEAMSILEAHVRAVGVQSALHLVEQAQALFGAAIAERRIDARLGQRAAVDAHLLGRLAVDVSGPRSMKCCANA